MSLVQRLAKFVVPRALFVQMRESSERWMIQCTACLSQRSVWEAGGIPVGAATTGKRIAAQCGTCHELVAAKVYRREDVALNGSKSKPAKP
jgi:hypothetical protein